MNQKTFLNGLSNGKKDIIRELIDLMNQNIASLEDVLTGKVWDYSDKQRRGSKRQKDLADIMRIIESFPELKARLPESTIESINRNL